MVSPSLVGTAYAASAATLTKAALRAGSLAAQQRRYAAVDAAITPKEFVAPDLSTARARAAAAAAGVDLSSRASIDAADAAYSARQAAEHAARP